jgi:DNA polymerase-3 subunit delta'
VIIGHEAAAAELLAAWRSGRMPHGWLLYGPEGIGKATLARQFATWVLAGGEGESFSLPENHPTARRMAAGGHADFTLVTRSENDSGNLRDEIVVDDVRKIEPMFRRTAAEGGWRVVLVDEADRMNINAQNAILKILEEPPPKALLLLTAAQPGRLLPTIRSRVRRVSMGALPETKVAEILTQHGIAEAKELAAFSCGAPGLALAIHAAEGLQSCREFVALALKGEVKARLDFAERHGRKGGEAAYAVLARYIPEWLQQVVKTSVGLADSPLRLPPNKALALYDRAVELLRNAESLNLDKKQALLSLFFMLDEAQKAVA